MKNIKTSRLKYKCIGRTSSIKVTSLSSEILKMVWVKNARSLILLLIILSQFHSRVSFGLSWSLTINHMMYSTQGILILIRLSLCIPLLCCHLKNKNKNLIWLYKLPCSNTLRTCYCIKKGILGAKIARSVGSCFDTSTLACLHVRNPFPSWLHLDEGAPHSLSWFLGERWAIS